MEHVKNAQVRSQAFLKFIIFFSLTTAMIVTAVYFNFKIPLKNTQIQIEKINDYENQLYQQQQFTNTMVKAKNLMDSMSKSGQINAFMEREMAKQIEIMKRPEYKDSSIYSTMNQEIINMLYDYYELNKNFIKSKDVMQQVEKLSNDLNKCETRLINSERDLTIYKTNSNISY